VILKNLKCDFCGRMTDEQGVKGDPCLCQKCRADFEETVGPIDAARTMIRKIEGENL
jgi:hypothetical protein